MGVTVVYKFFRLTGSACFRGSGTEGGTKVSEPIRISAWLPEQKFESVHSFWSLLCSQVIRPNANRELFYTNKIGSIISEATTLTGSCFMDGNMKGIGLVPLPVEPVDQFKH
jgi:hypothetical protein